MVYLGDVLTSGATLAFSGLIIQILAGFDYKTDALKNNIETFSIAFSAQGKNFEFFKNQHLYVIADGERFDLGEGDYESGLKRNFLSELKTNEILSFDLSRERFEKFSTAKALEIKVGSREFKIKENTQRGFANVLILGTL